MLTDEVAPQSPPPAETRPLPQSLFALIELPDLITLAGAACGFLAMLMAVTGRSWLALDLMMLAVLCDNFDGKLARWLDRKHKGFGAELDNLSDFASFAIAPAVFVFSLGHTAPWQVAVLVLFCLAGLLRLARFSYAKPEPGTFRGMPLIYVPIAIAVVYLLPIPAPYDRDVFLGILALATPLMVSTIRWPKI